MKKRIGILGGTFNPPHIGHLMMANEALNALSLDEIRFMPNGVPPHKAVDMPVSDAERLAMLSIATAPYPYFKVEPYEINKGGISYTAITMRELTKREPEAAFYFIMGGDMIESLHTWHDIGTLNRLVTFVGFARPHTQAQTIYNVQMVDAPQFDISSTMLRRRFKEGRTVQFLIPEAVANYVREEGLYGATTTTSGH
ncbi:putative nicotinate-nucleotide adenylyltransferase [Metalysinibacillus saudimassiliensis]|uniref:Probable nicotinate-nucleotide adenylyltransferase n=1 Tax=Metalysinibacillus saudimassiliensis TaxID=1461583 RepID=A0A078LXQ5_9BACL|nr:putative nicotinate-nucleotide adenylyltransferase [Metalysinibacillus saudimassiliensis]